MTITLASLLVRTTKTALYETALGIAAALKLPVSSWQAGDPTRSLYHYEAEAFEKLEEWAVGAISSHFLDEAVGVWLKYGAKQRFNVDVPEASEATTDVTLTNSSGYVYVIEVGDLTFKNTETGKTYRNTTAGTIPARVGSTDGTVDLTVKADEAGSESSAGAGEIDALITALAGVTCSNALPAVGVDEQDAATTRAQCLAKLDAISTMKGAYDYVAREPTLAGTSACTRVRTYSDSDTGDVTVYCAGPAGGVVEADRLLIEDGIATYATPLCITPTVLAATNVVVPVTYTLWLYTTANVTAAEAAAEVETSLLALFASLEIGGDIIPPATTGTLYQSLIQSTILGTYPGNAFRVTMALPSGDTALTNGQVSTLGTVTATVNLVAP